MLIINDTSGEIVTVAPKTNGSFTGKIMAQLGDEIKILSMDSSGNQTLITYITFKSDDGQYLVTAKGGIVEGEGGLKLDIPEGALLGPTVIKITPVTQDQLPLDNPIPSGAKFIAGVSVDAGGMSFGREVQISVPFPANMPANAFAFVAQPQTLLNADGTAEKVYVIIDSAKVVNGRLTSACVPFPGIVYPGLYVFLINDTYNYLHTTSEDKGPVTISGFTYRDMDGLQGYQPGQGDNNDKPISNAIVRAPGAENIISYSDKNGHYATYGFTAPDVCRNFPITAIHPQTMNRVTVNITTCDAPYIVDNFNFKLAEKDSHFPDRSAPMISMNMQVVPGQGPDARFVAGTVPIGTELEIPVSILDQEMRKATIKLSFNTAMTGDQSLGVTLQSSGSTIATYISETNPVAINKYTYTPGFSFPIAGSQSRYFKPDKPGKYSFTIDATDAAGNVSSRSMSVRAVEPGTQPGGVEGPPQVDELTPFDGSTNIMVTMPINATFNEPVTHVTDTTFKLIDLGPADLATDATFSSVQVLATVATMLEGGRVRATLVPANNLMFNRKYKIILTRDVSDSIENLESICAAQTPPLADKCFLPLDKEYGSVFTTKVPQVYDLAEGTFQQGKDIALYTDGGDGSTYAYVTAGNKGWYVIDVTDPTQPEIVKDHPSPNSYWSYRNLAVDQEAGILGMTENIEFFDGNQYGYVRFYDLTNNPEADPPTTPADPKVVGREKVAEAYSGIPGRLSIKDGFAYVATVGVGLQVVDINATRNLMTEGKPVDGSTIVGIYDTIGQGYKQPTDITVYKTGRAALTTTSGHLIIFDLSIPQIPQEMAVFKPAMPNTYNYDSAWRIAVAPEYVYTPSPLAGEGGGEGSALSGAGGDKVIDLAVTVSMKGRIHTIDLTDPYNPVVMGVTKDGSGVELGIQSASDITISKPSSLAYITAGNAIYIIDIKDPNKPTLLNMITQTPEEPGSSVISQLGYSNALVEQGGWVYLANQQKGMRVLDLDPLVIDIWDAEQKKILNTEELKYSDGTNDEKKYQIILKLNGQLQAEPGDCLRLNNSKSTLSVIDSRGTVTSSMVNGKSVLQEYSLSFIFETTSHECRVVINVPDRNEGWPYFILSNRNDLSVPDRTVKVTPGLTGRSVQVKIPSLDGKVYISSRIIEPIGVVVLAIDGLRQDVLYSSNEAAYTDSTGCGASCNVPITEATLPGLSQILKPESTIKLPNVATIFPSITFAAWASIFTGKPPKETGILGNEFFAPDVTSIAGLETLPPGMITLDADGGAFRPAASTSGIMSVLSTFKPSAPFALQYVMPAEFLGYESLKAKLNNSVPGALVNAEPLWKEINDMVAKRYPSATNRGCNTDDPECRCDKKNFECRTVSIFNQYVKGVDWWGTPSLRWKYLWELPTLFDTASASEAVDFISSYFEKKSPSGKRKRFPALFSVYLPGLDHEAHMKGMGKYSEYFKNTVDVKMNEIIQALKDHDEFENKIFIIVSDHGETQMPMTDEITLYSGTLDERTIIPETSCELKTQGFNKRSVQDAEKSNNSLHIWELGKILQIAGKENQNNSDWWFRVLAPINIADLFKMKNKTTQEIISLPFGAIANSADIEVAMNGPMAHIYVNDLHRLGSIAELLRLTLGDYSTEAGKWWNMDTLDYTAFKENAVGNLKISIDKILVRRHRTGYQSDYCVFDGLNDDGSIKCTQGDPFANDPYVRAWDRIKDMNSISRSGDIVLIMKDSTSGTASGRYSTGYACKAWHGSLNLGDSYVPFIVSYPAGSKTEVEKLLQKGELCKADYSRCSNNWNMYDIVKGILSDQY